MNDLHVEERNQRLVDAISRKQRFTIRIMKNCSSNGEIDVRLNPPFKPHRPDANFYISLIDFATTNLVANVNNTNNKFYYNNGSEEKVLTIPTGFYLIKSYNTEIKRLIKENSDDPDAITIEINDATGLVNLTLAKNYFVLFDKEKTMRKKLREKNLVMDLQYSEVMEIM